MRTVSLQFEEVITNRTKHGKCPSCGKTTVRQKKFSQTVNPWNKNSDGTSKTPDEVRADVNKEADDWVPDFRHKTAECSA